MTKSLGWRMARYFLTLLLLPAVHVPLGFPGLGSIKHKCRGRYQDGDVLNLSLSADVWQRKLFFCSLASACSFAFKTKGVLNSKGCTELVSNLSRLYSVYVVI